MPKRVPPLSVKTLASVRPCEKPIDACKTKAHSFVQWVRQPSDAPLMAASATFALKAGVWFRRGRRFIVSPDSRATACPPSGRNSTYRPVQISEASSKRNHMTKIFVLVLCLISSPVLAQTHNQPSNHNTTSP
jgi:hypothetical protein